MRATAAILGLALTLWAAGAGADASTVRFCNPDGGIRTEPTARGLRIRYLDRKGRPTRVSFTLGGWEVRSTLPGNGGVCLELARKASGKTSPGVRHRARDEVRESGGAFQEKVIHRRTQKVIEQGGERIVIEENRLVSPKTKK